MVNTTISFKKCQMHDFRKSIDSLEKVLSRSDIPSQYFSLHGFRDEAICLERADGHWLVYHGERGNKYDTAKYDNPYEACIDMIKRLSSDDETARSLIHDYKRTEDIQFISYDAAKEYLRQKSHLSAFKINDEGIPRPDVIKVANELYKKNRINLLS